jgi:hypothetical protein
MLSPRTLNLRLTWNAGVGLVLVILGVAQAALTNLSTERGARYAVLEGLGVN